MKIWVTVSSCHQFAWHWEKQKRKTHNRDDAEIWEKLLIDPNLDMQSVREEFNFKRKFQIKNFQSPAHKNTFQAVTLAVTDCLLLSHITSTVFLFLSVCSAHTNRNCCWKRSFALRVKSDHAPLKYARKFHWHSDCHNKNKSIMHGNNSALGP